MSIYRSEKMYLCSLILHKEVAFIALVKLGDLKMMQFNDLNRNESINFKYINEIRRCNELLKIIEYLQGEIQRYEIPTHKIKKTNETPKQSHLNEIEASLLKIEEDLKAVSKNYDKIKDELLIMKEKKNVLLKTNVFFGEDGPIIMTDSVIMSLLSNVTDTDKSLSEKKVNFPQFNESDIELAQASKQQNMKIEFISGTILAEKFHSFEKAIWRTCHRNYYMKNAPLKKIGKKRKKKQKKKQKLKKQIFIIFFASNQIKIIVKKICKGYNATLYSCPETLKERQELLAKVKIDILDLKLIIFQTDAERQEILVMCSDELEKWELILRKLKAVYFILNQMEMDEQNNFFFAECWVPECHFDQVRTELSRIEKNSYYPILQEIVTNKLPPTYFRTNKFTNAFQTLTNTYGIPTYREINPAFFSIITFPFLFAVMFGDIGHGLLMFSFACWMVIKEKSLSETSTDNEIWFMLFSGRYLLLMMGIFSIYAGFIYNSMFAIGLSLLSSSWRVNSNQTMLEKDGLFILDPSTNDFIGSAYIFGMDPAWFMSLNLIIFFNSFKMKISIVLGVCQMLLGLILNAVNYIHFKNYANFFLIFLPQIFFMLSIFFYLAFLIVLKWIIYSAKNTGRYSETCAPSILIAFINMCLFKSDEPLEGCSKLMYPNQNIVELCLIGIAILSIPILFFGKIITTYFTRKKTPMNETKERNHQEHNRYYLLNSIVVDSRSKRRLTFHETHEIDMSELVIHQGILVIETVLGSISHTASYLRLWALSLAHEQLSTVLYYMIMTAAYSAPGFVEVLVIVICFIFWAVLTLCVLVLMEGLSAFLHTLRLHWVEFQSKFYEGGGYLFEPFAFNFSKA